MIQPVTVAVWLACALAPLTTPPAQTHFAHVAHVHTAAVSRAIDDDAPAETFSVALQPWKKGDAFRVHSISKDRLSVVVSLDDEVVERFDQDTRDDCAKDVEILSVDDSGPQRWRVHYGERTHTVESQDVDASTLDEDPLREHTFIVDRGETSTRVLDEDSKPVSDELEIAVLREEEVVGGTPKRGSDALAVELDGRTFTIGRKVEITEETARALFRADDELRSIEITLTPDAVRELDGQRLFVFAMNVELETRTSGDEPLTLHAKLAGECALDARTGRVRRIELEGSSRLEGSAGEAGAEVKITAEGPWSYLEETEPR